MNKETPKPTEIDTTLTPQTTDAGTSSQPARAEEECGSASAPAPAATDLGAGFDEVKETLSQHFRRGVWNPLGGPAESAPTPPLDEHLQELAEDMLDLMRRAMALEAGQAELIKRVTQLEETARGGFFQNAREIDTLRRELLGDQKGFIALHAFHALSPAMERFQNMRAGLHPKKNQPLVAQLDAVLEIMAQAVKELGVTPFEPAVGDPFDPHTMVVAGYQKGEQRVVLGVSRPGFKMGNLIAKHAGVLVAEPESTPK